jgi:hypothetical protein
MQQLVGEIFRAPDKGDRDETLRHPCTADIDHCQRGFGC